MLKFWSLTTAIAGAAFALATTPGAQAGQFDGVTVNVMTQTGAIQEPLQRRAPEFEKLTGAKINIIAVPFSDLYQKVLTDWASGTNSVDAAVFAPQWMVDYVAGGYLEDIGARIAKDKDLQWDQIAPFFRELLRDVRRQDLPHSARWRLPHALLPDRRAREGWPEAAHDVGRVPRRREGGERQGFQWRRHEGLRLLHRQETQCAELLVRDRHHRLDGAVEGHGPGDVLRHEGHEAADRQRGVPQGARLPQGVPASTGRRTNSTWT